MWLYQGKEFTSEQIQDYKGFVYELTDTVNGMKYIGQKRFWKKITRPPLKGKKRKRRSLVESDWQDYYGSNEAINLLVESEGQERFKREILYLCNGTGEMNYMESKIQFDRDVLFRDDYYNRIIQCRIHAKHVGKMRNNLTNT